jgi:type IV secretory pathway VirB10-like protein
MKLIAIKKMTYATRHLVAGDPFEAKDRDARILIGIRKAKPAAAKTPQRPKATATPPPPVMPPPPANEAVEAPEEQPSMPGSEIARLRKTARQVGLVVDKRWGSQRLRDEIAKVRGY